MDNLDREEEKQSHEDAEELAHLEFTAVLFHGRIQDPSPSVENMRVLNSFIN